MKKAKRIKPLTGKQSARAAIRAGQLKNIYECFEGMAHVSLSLRLVGLIPPADAIKTYIRIISANLEELIK